MALFTLANASHNPLKYEQLNSEETVTAASSLPTTAVTQMATGTERNALQGTALTSAATTPLRSIIGNNADTANSGIHATANAAGNYGSQADAQSFNGVATAYAPGGNNLSAETTFASHNNAGDIAQSNSSHTSNTDNTQITITNPPGSNPPDGPNPPNNPNPPTNPPVTPDNPPAGSHNPDITLDLNTGPLPGVHLDADITQTVQPVATLLENTLEELLAGNPQTIGNLVTGTLDTLGDLLTGGTVNAGLGNLPLLGQGNGGGTAQLVNIGLGDSGNAPVAPLLDLRALQNLPSLSEIKLDDTLDNVTQTVPTLLQNPLGNLSGTLSGLLGGTGPLAGVTVGADNGSASGAVANLNVLDNLPLTDLPVAGNLLEGLAGSVPLGDTTLAGTLDGTSQLLGITVGDTDAGASLLGDVGLLQSGTLASVGTPLLGDQPLLEVPLDANGLPDVAATVQNTLPAAEAALDNLSGIASGAVDNLTDTVTGLPLQDAAADLAGNLTDTLGNVTENLSPVLENIPTTVQDALPVVTDTASQTLNALQDALGSLPDGGTPNPLETVTGILAGATQDNPVLEAVPSQVTDILQGILGGGNPLIDASPHPNDTSASLLDASLPSNIDLTDSQLLDLNLGSGNTSSDGSLLNIDVLQSTDIPGGDILSQLLDSVGTTVGTVTAPVTETLADVVTQPEAVTSAAVSMLEDTLASAPETIADILTQTTGSVADIINSTIAQTSAPASVVETVAQTTTALTSTVENVTSTTTDVVNTVTAPVAPVVNTVTAPVTSIIKNITSPLHGLFG